MLVRPDSIKGCDDRGNFYGSQAELAKAQTDNRTAWYAANAAYWKDGYGGRTDDEAMIGDEGGEEDGAEGLAFLDRLLAGDGDRVSNRPLAFDRALDAGAGVGRITKLVLLKRYREIRLVEGDVGWSRRSRAYLGRKRCDGRCTFTCTRLEDLDQNTIAGWGAPSDVVWLQWTLQYLTDLDAIDTLRNLALSLVETGYLIVKENRPYGGARLDRFQMDTPDGGSGRYDITRTDNHHRLLFQRAGLVVDLAEVGVETNTYALVVGSLLA